MTTWEYNECGTVVSFASLWVNSTGYPGEFQISHFQDLENLMGSCS